MIVPCNNYGGISQFVLKKLENNHIPFPNILMSPGDVSYMDSQTVFNNSNYIGFAATVNVDENLSAVHYIKSILTSIIEFSSLNNIRDINLPLLGTGAGKLGIEDVVPEFIEAFQSSTDLVVTVFAYSYNDYQIAKKIIDDNQSISIKIPRVFLSYSSTSSENSNWTNNLASQLRRNGVDAIIDVQDLKPGYDLPQWMTNEIVKADKVLLVCDASYTEKSDARNAGVGWEAMIIQGDMLWNGNKTNKYIAIARESKFDASIPLYMRSKYSFHWPDDMIPESEFKKLMLAIFDCEIREPVGKAPEYITDALKQKKIRS